LETYARYVDQGMLPNRFPDDGEIPEYNTADATLWYFEAIRAYLWRTEDLKLVDSLYPTLQAIVDWHLDGTRYGIQVDADDGLLRAGEPGVQLTWMDVKIGDWVVTPRTGKPVDINALWYNALEAMVDFSTQLGKEASMYRELAARAKKGFLRFWVDSLGYCADVLDGPAGEDRSLRPNQLFAVSLPFSPFSWSQQKSIVDRCAQDLYISHGLRSLASADPAYIGTYGGDQSERDASYHQGAAWGWLIGPFLTAHWRVYQDRARVISYLQPLLENLNSHGVGTLSEIYEGNPPFTPRGCFAQAWTVGEVLRIWDLIHREGSSR
jgi:predicted glycogen debranching enzyme